MTIIMFDMSSIMMQTLGTSGIDVVGLITAIGSIIIAVGAVSHSLAQRPELKRHQAALQGTAEFLKDLGGHVIDSKEETGQLATIVYDNMGPEAQKIVNKQAVRLAELEKKLVTAQAQLEKIPAALDHI